MVFKRKEKEDSQSNKALSDVDVHMKYWELVHELVCVKLSQEPLLLLI